MEDYLNLYHQSVLESRKLILEARYYTHHRAEWEEDLSQERLGLAEANLKEAERMLIKWEESYERRKRQDSGDQKAPLRFAARSG